MKIQESEIYEIDSGLENYDKVEGIELKLGMGLIPVCDREKNQDKFFNIQKGGKSPPGSSPGPALKVVPFGNPNKTRPGRVLRYPHCGCSGAAPAKPCKASAAAMLAWLWSSRRGFCNARA